MPPPIIVFDLDGTLIDTAPDLLDSLNHVITADGLAPVPPHELRAHVGHGGRAMLQHVHAAQGRSLDERTQERLFDAFIDHYVAGMPGASRPFDGALACMDRFARQGWLMAVCTNKLDGLSRTLLTALGIADRFAAICGADTFAVRKPDPGHLFGTIDRAGGEAENAVMVGDSRTDIDTARAAGIPVVAVDFGYSTEPVKTLGPDRVISHFDALTVQMARALIDARPVRTARPAASRR